MLALVDKVSSGEVKGDAARRRIAECDELVTMSSEEAVSILKRVYEIASKNDDASVRLRVSLLERGDIVSLLEDARSLSPGARRAKWDADAATRERERRLQIERSERVAEGCATKLANKEANRAAWRAAEGASSSNTLELLCAPEETLLLRPPLFWKGLPLEDLPEQLMRASMGRIDLLLSKHGRGRFPASLAKRYDEQLARQPMPTSPDAVCDAGPATTPWCGCLPSFARRSQKRERW